MPPRFSLQQQRTIDRVKEQGHPYVLRWLGELAEGELAGFLEQLAAVDFERVGEFARLIAGGGQGNRATCEDIEPAPVDRLPRTDAECTAERHALGLGRKALEDDRAAALVVAGGQGTRLGYNAPKGTYPITPVRKKSLFQVQAEKILSARRRYGCRLPWLVMTSLANDADTRAFFAQHDFFGLGRDSVHFFAQKNNPILGAGGRLLLEAKGRLLTGPDGHGGVFEALLAGGMLDVLESAGHDLISYFQVDNPLVPVADERFLGHHVGQGADFSCKVVPKRDPSEGLGVAALHGGSPVVVEYIDLPKEMAEQRGADGELRYLFGSIAVHVIGTAFARRMGERGDALPWHVARKKYAALDEAGEAAPGDCYKFERFVFDCLPHARACAFVEVDRADEFAPVKNAEGQDSPECCRGMMKAQWLRWLTEAGMDVSALQAPDAQVEISPLVAANAAELKARLPQQRRLSPPFVLD